MYPYPYPAPAAALINGIASAVPDDDPNKPKKSAFYRVGQGAALAGNAANAFTNTVENAANQAVSGGVDAVKLGARNLARGFQGQPELSSLPPDPAAAPASAAPTAARAADAASGPNMFSTTVPGLVAPATRGAAFSNPAVNDPTAAAAPAIDSGVTVGGRHLNYGAMVGGVPTFSDGSGAPGAIPRTVTDKDIADLGARLNTTPAQVTPLASDALGYTPSSAEMVNTLVRNAQNPGGRFGVSPEMNAASDNAAVATGDWRSPLGTAAHNLAVDAGAPGSVLQRRTALQNLSNLADTTAKTGQLGIDNAAQLQRTGLANQNALDTENLRGEYGIADEYARSAADAANRKPDQVTLADNSIGLLDPKTGTVRRATLADGSTATTNSKETLSQKDLNDEALKLMPQLLGQDPVTGLINDPANPGKQRAATPEETQAALARARGIISGNAGPASGQKPTLDKFVSAARAQGSKMTDQQLRQAFQALHGS